MIVTDCINEYFALIKERPELFLESNIYRIVTDIDKIRKFEREHNKKIGVIYKSQFNTFVVDLVESEGGLLAYERVIPSATGRGVVCIPIIDGKILLLKQYRHGIRDFQLGFPRGFGENGLTSEENVKKELFEEIGAKTIDCRFIGSVTPDSGISGTRCDVFLARVESYDESRNIEGIVDVIPMKPDILLQKITAKEIDDSFTLSAFALLKSSMLL